MVNGLKVDIGVFVNTDGQMPNVFKKKKHVAALKIEISLSQLKKLNISMRRKILSGSYRYVKEGDF